MKYESINPDSIDVGAETIALKSESLDANLEKQSLQKQITSHLKAFEKELESFGVDKELIFHIKQSIFEFLTNNEKDSIEPDRLIEFLKSNAPGFDALYNSHQKEAKNALNNLLKKLFVKEESVEKAFVENKSAVKDDSDTDRIRRSFEKMFVRVSEDSKDMDVKRSIKACMKSWTPLQKPWKHRKFWGKKICS